MGRQSDLRKARSFEKADGRKMELPTGLGLPPPPLREQMIALIRNEMSTYALATNKETFADFDDFEDTDDAPMDQTIFQTAVLAAENPELFDPQELSPPPDEPLAKPPSDEAVTASEPPSGDVPTVDPQPR